MSASPKGPNHFKVMLILFAVWAGLLVFTLATKAAALARGVMPLISVILLGWLAYWTISAIRGRFTTAPVEPQPQSEPEVKCQQESVKQKSRTPKNR